MKCGSYLFALICHCNEHEGLRRGGIIIWVERQGDTTCYICKVLIR
jgi:hypothetical protein